MTAKLLLFSVVIAMTALPLLVARNATGPRAIQKIAIFILAFNLFYLFAVRFIYPRLQ